MKKIIRTLLMITCVLGLTACGSKNQISEYQQQKIDNAESLSTSVISVMSSFVADPESMELMPEFNNVELGDWFAYYYQVNTGYSSFRCAGKGIRSGVSSFTDGLETLGGIVSLGEPTSKYDDKEIIVTVPVIGVNGNASVECIYSNDLYFEMSACTLNVEESFGSLMGRAGLNTLIGMGTVFLVLILISLIISCFKFIPNIQNAFKKKETPAQVTEVAPAVVETATEELSDDTELVAVIAAAIAAYEGTSADGFQVRSIKRANTRNWQRQ